MADWTDLPFDLIRDVALRLHAAADFVRFHAVCKPWRDAVPPPPAFFPWLLAPRDATRHRTARRVDLITPSTSSSGGSTGAMRVRDKRWLFSADDGAAVYFLATTRPDPSGSDGDPITGTAAYLPPCRDEKIETWVENARPAGGVSSDGTVFLHGDAFFSRFKAAVLRPGETKWTTVERMDRDVPEAFSAANKNRRCVAYHDGKIVMCQGNSLWAIQPRTEHAAAADRRWFCWPQVEYSYVLESRGELLWVVVDTEDLAAGSVALTGPPHSVSVCAVDMVEWRWVPRDARSLVDRVLFLGRPSSFAVDAARLGMSGGCAYFVDRKRTASGVLEWSRVFRYRFDDGRSEMVEQLPAAEWSDEACMWVTPQPAAIATTKEIRERLKARNACAVDGDQTFQH